MDSSYLNLVRGNRLSSYMGLQMLGEAVYKFASDYSYIEIPILGFEAANSTELTQKALRNQYVRVVPACLVDVKGGYRAQVEPNPAIAEYGLMQPTYYIHSNEGGKSPGFYFQARKDIEASDLTFAVRLYMRA